MISLIPVMQIAFCFHIYDQQVADLIAAAASSVFCLICKITHYGLGAEGTKLTVSTSEVLGGQLILRLLLMLTVLLSFWELCMVSVHCHDQNDSRSARRGGTLTNSNATFVVLP